MQLVTVIHRCPPHTANLMDTAMFGVEEIERLLQTARPGTQFQLLQITVPEDPRISVPAHHDVESDFERPTCTPQAFADWVRDTYGREALKVEEWVPLVRESFGISGRRLAAAIRCGEIPSFLKGNGLDHRARMVEVGPMHDYLHQLEAGDEPVHSQGWDMK